MVLISQPLTSSSLPSSSSSSSFDAGLENFTATTDKTAVIISSSEKKTDNADQVSLLPLAFCIIIIIVIMI